MAAAVRLGSMLILSIDLPWAVESVRERNGSPYICSPFSLSMIALILSRYFTEEILFRAEIWA